MMNKQIRNGPDRSSERIDELRKEEIWFPLQESQRESAPELGQMMGRGHETGSPGVLTLTCWWTALLRVLEECPDHSYSCTIHKTFEPFRHPQPVNCADLEWMRAGAEKPVGGMVQQPF